MDAVHKANSDKSHIVLSHLLSVDLKAIYKKEQCDYLQFLDGKIEAYRGEVTCLESSCGSEVFVLKADLKTSAIDLCVKNSRGKTFYSGQLIA